MIVGHLIQIKSVFSQSISEVQRWCWVIRPASLASVQVHPKGVDGAEIGALCRPVQFFHTTLGKLSLYGPCFVHRHLTPVMLKQEHLKHKLLTQSWRHTRIELLFSQQAFWKERKSTSVNNINEGSVLFMFQWVSQHEKYQDLESEAAKCNSDIFNFIIYTFAFLTVTCQNVFCVKCLLFQTSLAYVL